MLYNAWFYNYYYSYIFIIYNNNAQNIQTEYIVYMKFCDTMILLTMRPFILLIRYVDFLRF